VRDEELDWEIYHVLADGKSDTLQGLISLGYDPRLVEESVRRLERYGLIERAGESVRALSVPEAILLCQARNQEACPFVVEDGVIRERPRREEKP
jgi:hypothetical protein